MMTAAEVLSAGAGAVCGVPVQFVASALFRSLPIGCYLLHHQDQEVRASYRGLNSRA